MTSIEAEDDPSKNQFFRLIMDKDNVADGWLMFASPVPMVTVMALYLAAVCWGPRLMEGRPAFRLDGLMRIYNLGQVAYNTILLYNVFTKSGVIGAMIKMSCSVEGYEKLGDLKEGYLYVSWHYIFLKVLDLIDTVR